jgi:uncharacterized phiE125 gp8 family phage protein
MLTELERPEVAPDLISMLADQLRMPSGFAGDAAVEELLSRCIGFAIGFVEKRTGRALVQRRFRFSTWSWDVTGRCALPIGPAVSLEAFALIDAAANCTSFDPALFRIAALGHPPLLVGRDGGALPAIPLDGVAEIDFTAGWGPSWADAPVDLREATILIAAASFERADAEATAPMGALRLLEPYRSVRL